MSLGDTISGYTFGIELGKFQVETIPQVNGLSIGLDAVAVEQMTPDGQLPINYAQGGEITITRGPDRSKAFTDWIETTLVKRDMDTARRDIAITVLDWDMPVRRIHLLGAWVSDRRELPPAGAEGSATEEVTITYEESKIEDI
ncbi:phage tail protein [Nocardia sp. NPDC050710]|uniref:phage tail protein n=1 Tax=Nocardia sp. NPDC050710 TaxID=3157220 RepID=UPI0034056C61